MANYQLEYTDDVPAAGAAAFAAAARESVTDRGRFVALLSGGSTPQPMFRLLARQEDLPWGATHVLWGDERYVPHDHPDSNYRMTRELLLEHVPIPPGQVHPWPYYEGDPERSAREIARLIMREFDRPPFFDFNLMGIGDDGHTASLFPGTGAVHATGLTTVVRPEGEHVRLSLTVPALSQSRRVVFLVSGENKREALRHTLHGKTEVDRYPAQAIGTQGELRWITDIRL